MLYKQEISIISPDFLLLSVVFMSCDLVPRTVEKPCRLSLMSTSRTLNELFTFVGFFADTFHTCVIAQRVLTECFFLLGYPVFVFTCLLYSTVFRVASAKFY